ncbi:FAD-binding oxidoreductase [Tautonia sociabilis]|uniref:FAD-binding oxidoreductase n=1 Tax=Tautonia sociabilis TaxID=2080755 RepID=UPI001F19DA7A|nr:FAD-binding oxidoreductase [Tautonia sociabilis]
MFAVSVGLALALPSYGQVSPEEHAQHHPGAATAGPPSATPPAGPMSGMMGGGGMGGMGEMMEQMHGPPPKELYPSLMALPELPPERRAGLERQAHGRMQAGTALLSEGLDQLSRSAPGDDFAAMQAATARMREGLAQFESGLAAHRALAEGTSPRNVALQWFKREMSLLPPAGTAGEAGSIGVSWFHGFVMVALVAFAAAMIAMYFSKMRRAARLLQGLTGGGPPGVAPEAAAPPVRSASSAVGQAPPGDAARTAAGRRWSGRLRVARIFQETPNVKTFRLMNPLGGVLPFAYLPGQFLTVAVPVDGKPVRRSYTIASSPTQQDFAEITVKHEPGGVVSGYLDERVKEDDLLEFSGPTGSFTFTGRECKCILLIGAGVGITPLMSVLRYLIDRSWPGDIFLLYGCKSPRDIIFREELEYLQHRHPNLKVVVTVTRPEGTGWAGPTGRITKELIAQSVPDLASRYVHICGPVPFMESMKKALAELGVPAERIKTEAFGPALGRPEPTSPSAVATAEAPATGVALPTLTFSASGKSAPLPPDKVVLEVADEIGVEIDNSCRVGTCGICRVKLLAGEVTMAVEDGLEPGDKENRIILACQAKSAGDVTVEA